MVPDGFQKTPLGIEMWMEVGCRHQVQVEYKQEQREVKKKRLREIEVLRNWEIPWGRLAV